MLGIILDTIGEITGFHPVEDTVAIGVAGAAVAGAAWESGKQSADSPQASRIDVDARKVGELMDAYYALEHAKRSNKPLGGPVTDRLACAARAVFADAICPERNEASSS